MKNLKVVTDELDGLTQGMEQGIIIHLELSCINSTPELKQLAHDYGLVVLEQRGSLCLVTEKLSSGGHKKQSLALFMAALEIHLNWPCSKGLLVQTWLESNQRDVCLKDWEKQEGALFFDSPVAFYLKEAGLEVGSGEKRLNSLNSKEVHMLISKLISNRQKVRRVA